MGFLSVIYVSLISIGVVVAAAYSWYQKYFEMSDTTRGTALIVFKAIGLAVTINTVALLVLHL